MSKQLGIIALIVGLIFLIIGWIDMSSEEGATSKTAVMSVGGFILFIIGVQFILQKPQTIQSVGGNNS